MTNNARLLLGSVLAAGLLAGPGLASAENKSDLDSQPAVRHRLLLVAKRLEATPLFESTDRKSVV